MCIFARQLGNVLQRYRLSFNDLYGVKVDNINGRIHPQQITRLKQAAAGDCSIGVALNPEEIDAITQVFSLDAEDVHELRSALAAESFYRFALNRIEKTVAKNIAEGTLHTLLSGDAKALAAWRDSFLDDFRFDSEELLEPLTDQEQSIQEDLAPAVDLFDEAQLWLFQASSVENESRCLAYLHAAETLLIGAADLLRDLTSEQQAPAYHEWVDIITNALADVQKARRSSD
jgi:hypothetical protein